MYLVPPLPPPLAPLPTLAIVTLLHTRYARIVNVILCAAESTGMLL